jgi:hypothetical protein
MPLLNSHEIAALRDQFAAAALTGLLAGGREYHGEEARESLALYAYACADAMMARRAQPTADAPAPASTAP